MRYGYAGFLRRRTRLDPVTAAQTEGVRSFVHWAPSLEGELAAGFGVDQRPSEHMLLAAALIRRGERDLSRIAQVTGVPRALVDLLSDRQPPTFRGSTTRHTTMSIGTRRSRLQRRQRSALLLVARSSAISSIALSLLAWSLLALVGGVAASLAATSGLLAVLAVACCHLGTRERRQGRP